MRTFGWLGIAALASVAFASGCGGRAAQTDLPNSTTASGSGGSGAAPLDFPQGATPGAATPTMPEPYETFVPLTIGQDPAGIPAGSMVPKWVDIDWRPSVGITLFNVCNQQLSHDDALAILVRAFPELGGTTRMVDASELSDTINQLQDPNAPRSEFRVLYVFALPDWAVGGLLVTSTTDANLFSYVMLDDACVPHRVGAYTEHLNGDGCGRYEGFPLWGIPSTLSAVRACYPTSGLYFVEAAVTHDDCRRSSQAISSVFSYCQRDAGHARLFFPQPPIDRVADEYELVVDAASAKGSKRTAAAAACPSALDGVAVTLESNLAIDLDENDTTCQGSDVAACRWHMVSLNAYGPLPAAVN